MIGRSFLRLVPQTNTQSVYPLISSMFPYFLETAHRQDQRQCQTDTWQDGATHLSRCGLSPRGSSSRSIFAIHKREECATLLHLQRRHQLQESHRSMSVACLLGFAQTTTSGGSIRTGLTHHCIRLERSQRVRSAAVGDCHLERSESAVCTGACCVFLCAACAVLPQRALSLSISLCAKSTALPTQIGST